MSGLPEAIHRYPDCGVCYGELEHDGDSFYCDDCGLDYGDGGVGAPTFRDEDDEPCGSESKDPLRVKVMPPTTARGPRLYRFTEGACLLPAGHKPGLGHYHASNCEQLEGPIPNE